MAEIEMHDSGGGVLLRVIVRPKGRRNAVMAIHGGALKVAVTAAPEKGKANMAVATLLAEFFGVAKENVVLQSGETSRRKVFLVDGLSSRRVVEILADKGII